MYVNSIRHIINCFKNNIFCCAGTGDRCEVCSFTTGYGASLCSLMPSASSSDVGGNGKSGESYEFRGQYFCISALNTDTHRPCVYGFRSCIVINIKKYERKLHFTYINSDSKLYCYSGCMKHYCRGYFLLTPCSILDISY